jgi:hypothetical protein
LAKSANDSPSSCRKCLRIANRFMSQLLHSLMFLGPLQPSWLHVTRRPRRGLNLERGCKYLYPPRSGFLGFL